VRRDLLEHSKPLSGDARLVVHQASDIAARPSQTRDESCTDRVGDAYKHDRNRAGFSLERGNIRRRICEDDVGAQGDQLFREHLRLFGARGRRVAIVDSDIAALRPSEPFEPFPERHQACLACRIVFGQAR
jgi:hypothetical protein